MNAFARALETTSQHRFTLEEVLRMQEAGILDPDARVELIDGGLIEMAPEGVPHVRVKMQVARSFMARADDAVQVIVDSTLRLSATSAPDPDLYLYDAAIPLAEVDGANVGLVVEVAQSTLGTDLIAKAELYAQYRVRDYWVVDLPANRLVVHRSPSDEGYGEISVLEAEALAVPLIFPQLALRLADLPAIR